MKVIALTQEKFALVDDEDFDYLNQWKWHYHKAYKKDKGYAARNSTQSEGGKKRIIQMHVVINKTPPGLGTDHRDMDGLNNQKHNLRNANHSQNRVNTIKLAGKTSRYVGVTLRRKKWRAVIRFQGKQKDIGVFDSEIEAARAYNSEAKKIHGEFARLNIIT